MKWPNEFTKQTSRRLAPLSIAALLLAACDASPTNPANTNGTAGGRSSASDQSANTPDNVQASFSDHAEPIAAIPGRRIALYPLDEPAVSEEGVVLEIGERRQQLDWRYTTPRQIMPVMQAGDYDGDGKDELAVVLNVDSGTGVTIDELHVVEFEDVNGSADEPFIDFMFPAEDYTIQLREALAFRKIERDGGWFGEVTAGGGTYEVALNDFLEAYRVGADAVEDALGYGNIIYFKAGDGALTMSAAVGLLVDGIAEPQYIGNVEAKVAYVPGVFTLSDYRFVPDP